MNSKIHSPLSFFLFVAAASTLVSCAARQNSSSNAPGSPATTQGGAAAIPGDFQGKLVNSSGVVEALLAMHITQSNSGLTAEIGLVNGSTALIPLEGESFSIDLPAKTYGESARLNVAATWNGQAWVGQLSTDSKPSNTFTLTSTQTSEAAQAATVSVGAPKGTFSGKLVYKSSGGKRDVALIILPSNDVGDELASTLTSKVALNAYLQYSNGQKEDLTNVIWDRDSSLLRGDGTIATSLGSVVIRCKMSEMNSGNKDVLQCAMSSTKSDSPVASGPLSQTRAATPVVISLPATVPPGPPQMPNPVPQPVPPPGPTPYVPPAPPQPAPTAAPVPVPTAIPVPVPTPSFYAEKERKFVGQAVFKNQAGAQQKRSISLTVTLKTDITGQDQPAEVLFLIDQSRVGADFINGTYNGTTFALDAKQSQGFGVLAGALELHCTQVNYASADYDFNCQYESSVTNVTADFHMKSISK